jgi:hypothetical protein
MATLDDAVEAFLCRERKVGGNLTSTGASLLSYGQCVGEWVGDAVVLRYEGIRRRTVIRHRNMLRRFASRQGIKIRENDTFSTLGIPRHRC